MLYAFVKFIAKGAIQLYCRDLQINQPALLAHKGPLILAANHPNSFLDAIVLCTIFKRPIYSLTRGDAFKGSLISRILFSLKLLPVYRMSEGVENLEDNYKTFDQCKEIFKKNGIVLIFSEGMCVNEWHLRPLKKGTARLAFSSWADDIPVKVLPVAINYSSFKRFGKNIQLFFGEFITLNEMDREDGEGKSIQTFNLNLQKQLAPYVFEIEELDKEKLRDRFYISQSVLKRIFLFFPSSIGWLLHVPLYYPIKNFILNKTIDTDHFDSVLVAILLLAYPWYVFIATLTAVILSGSWYAVSLLVIFPFTAWAHLQLKKQL